MIDTDLFLKDSRDLYIEKFNRYAAEATRSNTAQPDTVVVLGEIIEHFYKQYKLSNSSIDIFKTFGYDSIYLENNYEFCEDALDEFLKIDDVITCYNDALAYFSLNEAFVTSHYEMVRSMDSLEGECL